jgi:hypothetical protein
VKLFKSASSRHKSLAWLEKTSYDQVIEEMMAGCDIVHLAGVAYVDGTGESVVPFQDGQVRASELATLLIRRPPGLLFVNEDYSGLCPISAPKSLETTRSGTSITSCKQHCPGLERAAARSGVGTFIGCMGPSVEAPARDSGFGILR